MFASDLVELREGSDAPALRTRGDLPFSDDVAMVGERMDLVAKGTFNEFHSGGVSFRGHQRGPVRATWRMVPGRRWMPRCR